VTATRGAGDVAALIGGEQDVDRGELGGLAGASQRCVGAPKFSTFSAGMVAGISGVQTRCRCWRRHRGDASTRCLGRGREVTLGRWRLHRGHGHRLRDQFFLVGGRVAGPRDRGDQHHHDGEGERSGTAHGQVGLGQFDGSSGGDVGRKLMQSGGREADAERSERLAQHALDLGGGPAVLGAGQCLQHSAGVTASLVFDLTGHARAGWWHAADRALAMSLCCRLLCPCHPPLSRTGVLRRIERSRGPHHAATPPNGHTNPRLVVRRGS